MFILNTFLWVLYMSILKIVNAVEYDCEEGKNNPICLRGGSSSAEGNVYVDGLPVCDDGWDKLEADVVCKQLGHTRGALEATTDSQFGQVGEIFSMDNVACSGTEDNIKNCTHQERDDCGVHEAAGVICDAITPQEQVQDQELTIDCFMRSVEYKSEGAMSEIKKVSSATHCQRWCSENQDCEHFTFHTITKNCQRYSVMSANNKFKSKNSVISGPRECLQNKTILDNCQIKDNSKTICLFNTDNLTHAGNVFINEHPVCDDNWSVDDGRYFCEEFGYHEIRKITTMSFFGLVPSTFAQLDKEDGSGHGLGIGCDSSEGAGVICDTRDKVIIDREKDCFIGNLTFTEENKLDHETDVEYADDCQRDCEKTKECTHFTWFPDDNKCTLFNRNRIDGGKLEHPDAVSGPRLCSEDPSVQFDANQDSNEEDAICLVGGSSNNEGNLFVGGKPVCDDGWNIVNAHVACRQKGFIRAIEATTNSRFGNVPQVFGLDDVECTGMEAKLSDCKHTPTEDCEGFEAAGVICDTRDKDDIARSEQDLSEKCFAENVVYGAVMSDELIFVPTAADCQHYCQQDSQCQMFSYNNRTKECNRRKPVEDIDLETDEKLWRNDGQCGPNNRLPNGNVGQCNGNVLANPSFPCCSRYGWCGFTDEHCKCESCVNYLKSTFLVIAGDHVAESLTDIEKAKAKLKKVTSRIRMIAEVYANGTLKRDPHEVGGQNQGAGHAAGFNKWWSGGDDMNRMMDVAQYAVDTKKERSNGGVASLSTTHPSNNFPASKCIDGIGRTYCMSSINETYPYFVMEYPKPVLIKKIFILARTDGFGERVKQLIVSVTKFPPTPGELVSESGSSNTVGSFLGPAQNGQKIKFTFEGGVRGRFAVIQQEYKGTLNFAKVNIRIEPYLSHPSLKGKEIQTSTSDIISGPRYCPFESPVLLSEHCDEPVCLIGGSTPYEGNVYLGGNPICDDQWDINSGQIVCKQLRFGLAKNITLNSHFGDVQGPFGISNVECLGTEEGIMDCYHNESPQCLGSEAAGVICESRTERMIREGNEQKVNECFIEDTCYAGSEPDPSGDRLASSVENCQEHCEENEDCTHFSYHKDTWQCFFNKNEVKTHCSNVISGPKSCDKVDLAIKIPEDDPCRKEGKLCLWSKENGKMSSEGNVFVGGKPICDDSWSLVDGEVVCRQLQFHGIRDVTTHSHFGYVSGTFSLDDVQCTGAENNITECDYEKKDNCGGGEAAGVVCDTRDKESIEADQKKMKHCFMEDIEFGGISLTSSVNITVNVTDCHKQCEKQPKCTHFTFNTESHNCTLYESQNQGKSKKPSFGSYSGPKSCIDNANIVQINDVKDNHTDRTNLYLIGGSGKHEGNVFWGKKPVCDDAWDFINANIVCKQLGYFHALEFKTESHFGDVSITFSLDDVSCHGNETSLDDCRHTTNENCDGSEAAGVICDLRNETNILSNNQISACFAENITIGSILPVQRGTKEVEYTYLPSSIDCQKWCQHNELCGFFSFEMKSQKCYLRKDTYEKYQGDGFVSGPKNCVNNSLELKNHEEDDCFQPGVACLGGGTTPHEGNVYVGGKPVCDEIGSWGITNAHVFCKQMGYRRAKHFKTNSYFGNVTGPFFATNVHCIGNEKSIGACEFVPRANCLKMEAVGVVCETHFDVLMTEQNSQTCLEIDTQYSGTEITNANINGHGEKKDTVGGCQAACQMHPECQYFTYFTENNFSSKHRNLCRMLRFKAEIQSGIQHVISGPKQCRPCRQFDEVGKCNSYIEDKCYKDGEICLVGGSNTREGNVLVGGKSVCDDGWDKIDADVACKQLGFLLALNATIKSSFGSVSFDYGMDNVMCSGSEAELKDCKHESGDHDCSHDEGAGVVCLPNGAAPDCSDENEECCHPGYTVHDANMLQTNGLHFKAENVLKDDCDNFKAMVPDKTNYWLSPERQSGGYIIIDLGCSMVIDKITLKNTHNGKQNDRGLANFTILLSNSMDGLWHAVLQDQLKDVRNFGCSVPLENFSLGDKVEHARTGRFVKLEVDSYYGNGGGLQYLNIEGHQQDSSTSTGTQLSIGLSVSVIMIALVVAVIWWRRKKESRWQTIKTHDVISFSNLMTQISTNTD